MEKDDNVIRMDKKDFQREIAKSVNKAVKFTVRKNSSGEEATASPNNTNSGANGKSHLNKVKKAELKKAKNTLVLLEGSAKLGDRWSVSYPRSLS